ncbi:MAG TPA: zinc dependent phospholipase C family protein [Vicinamibacterales bacterium]|nr:zinc dependent phospholipase C family protein [Vicinamibacterales bacterium]
MARMTAAALSLVLVVCAAGDANAYSVLAHEANVDALWESGMRPILHQRFPSATAAALDAARAYAYGGSVIQDLGYYPFGNHFFSNLTHYVKSGTFVETLIRDARDVDELAFALGALAHYTSDNTGHPEAVNRSVPLLFPKLGRKFGPRVTYEEAPSSHVRTEFSFDVVQVAAGRYKSDAYHGFIGFHVAKPLLARAFHDTYGLNVEDVFDNEDLAIGSYRHAIADLIPEITRTAWREKKDEIAALVPSVGERTFIYRISRADYEKDFGSDYSRPGFFTRILVFLYRVLPKIGPLESLKFRAPTPEAERLFLQSVADSRRRLAVALAAVREGRLHLPDTNFDTGRPSQPGEYTLADKTSQQLAERLERHTR